MSPCKLRHRARLVRPAWPETEDHEVAPGVLAQRFEFGLDRLADAELLLLPGERPLLLDALRERHEGWLPAYMAAAAN